MKMAAVDGQGKVLCIVKPSKNFRRLSSQDLIQMTKAMRVALDRHTPAGDWHIAILNGRIIKERNFDLSSAIVVDVETIDHFKAGDRVTCSLHHSMSSLVFTLQPDPRLNDHVRFVHHSNDYVFDQYGQDGRLNTQWIFHAK